MPVDDVLRYAMCSAHYGREKEAMRLYSVLDPERRADHCVSCPAPCEKVGRFELPIRHKLLHADRLLRL